MVTIAVGLQERPSAAPQEGVWVPDYKIVGDPSFTKAITAVSTLIMAYAGTPGFFPIVSEMRDPTKYTRALFVCQTIVTVTYLVVGCVVYIYCGSYVASPALGSAGPLVKKISYGFALPGLIVTTLLVIHVRTHLSTLLFSANISVTGEIYLPSHPPRIQAPDHKHDDALGHMAQLYSCYYRDRIRDC